MAGRLLALSTGRRFNTKKHYLFVKNAVFWDVMPCGTYKYRGFGGTSIVVTLMMEVIRSSETTTLKRATWRNIPEDGILYSHRRENFKSYIASTGWAL
jgi:hypothetical protein